MVKRIFLDSRDWIILARVNNGKEPNADLKEVFEKIKLLSDSGNALFPFSMFHLEDLLKNTNKKQRESLIDFIIDISKGYVLKPFMLYRDKEIENAILQQLGLNPIHDIRSQIIGKGIAYVAGEEYHVTSTNPDVQKFLDEKDQEIRNIINSTESMAKIMKSENFSSFIRKGHQMYLDVALEMEKNRKQRITWTKTQRFDNELQSHFSRNVVPHLTKFLQENNLQNKISELFKTKNDFESFLDNTPSSNTLIRLTYARDEESIEREIQPNDLVDISHLAGAVPYCDIAVMEKMFASICLKIKLDKKYDCMVLNSLKSLNTVI